MSRADEPTGFLGRWSRRKEQARTGQPLAEPERTAPVPPETAAFESNRAPAPVQHAPAAPESEAKALTLDDVKALTAESDFSAFAARSVAPEVRNAAMKKLFADPRYNVMDGLDAFLDDFSQPAPMPAAMLARLASAHSLNLVADEPAAAPAPAPSLAARGSSASHTASPPAAPAPLPPAHHDQDPDLRLQPDDAARRGPHRPGAA